MRGARLTLAYRDPSTGNARRLWFAAVWRRCVRYRLRVSCSEASERAAGEEVLRVPTLAWSKRSNTRRMLLGGCRLDQWSTIQTFVASCTIPLSIMESSSNQENDLQSNVPNASRRRQRVVLFWYDSCDCDTASLKLMPDDARRPARLQGRRSAAAAAGTTHPCICLLLGMLVKESWIAQKHDGEDGVQRPVQTRQVTFAGGPLYRSITRVWD
jgi:hypothetical protein